MRAQRRNWNLGPFRTWRADWGDHLGGTVSRSYRAPKRQLDGARIIDDDAGLIYEAVVERANGRAYLTGITILTTHPGQRIDQETIRRVPVQRIAEQVSLHLSEQGPSGVPLFATEPHRSKHDGPSVEDVAQDHRDGLSRRDMAARWHASIHTIDKRLREARDRKLISPPTTGRPRRSAVQESESKSAVESKKRERGRE